MADQPQPTARDEVQRLLDEFLPEHPIYQPGRVWITEGLVHAARIERATAWNAPLYADAVGVRVSLELLFRDLIAGPDASGAELEAADAVVTAFREAIR